jgi:hypothetical protein
LIGKLEEIIQKKKEAQFTGHSKILRDQIMMCSHCIKATLTSSRLFIHNKTSSNGRLKIDNRSEPCSYMRRERPVEEGS